jgi:hypothetical protein
LTVHRIIKQDQVVSISSLYRVLVCKQILINWNHWERSVMLLALHELLRKHPSYAFFLWCIINDTAKCLVTFWTLYIVNPLGSTFKLIMKQINVLSWLYKYFLSDQINYMASFAQPSNNLQNWSDRLIWWLLGQVRIWVTLGHKLGHTSAIRKNIVNTSEATVLIKISCKLIRKVVLVIINSSLNMDHLGLKTRSHSLNFQKPEITLRATFNLNIIENRQ